MHNPATTKMKGSINLNKRVSWLIIDLIIRNDLSNTMLAEIMGCDKNSINNYRQMRTSPDMMFVKKLGEMFGVNVVWVHLGEGKPYVAPSISPPSLMEDGRGGGAILAASPATAGKATRKGKKKDAVEVGDDVESLIPGWAGEHAGAPSMNIEAIDRTIMAWKNEIKMRRELELLRKKVKELKGKVKSLKKGR